MKGKKQFFYEIFKEHMDADVFRVFLDTLKEALEWAMREDAK